MKILFKYRSIPEFDDKKCENCGNLFGVFDKKQCASCMAFLCSSCYQKYEVFFYFYWVWGIEIKI